MKLKELTDIMYATARVYLYDSDGFYCFPRLQRRSLQHPGIVYE